MPAYLVWVAGDPERGQEVVLASSMTEAKRRSELHWRGDVARKHLRAKRYPRFDGRDHVTGKDLLHDGWIFTCPECEIEYDRDTFATTRVDPALITESVLCPYCYPEDYGLVVFEDEDDETTLRPAGDAWRKGRKCATCRHYSREDEYCWRSSSGVMVPCHPGFDEDDPHMVLPLNCWEPAGGEQSRTIVSVDAECYISYSDGTSGRCTHQPAYTYAECEPGYGPGGHCPKWEYIHRTNGGEGHA